jgi:hypothetical protein
MTTAEANRFTSHIAALRGAPSEAIQDILARFGEERKREGLRVVGVVEVSRCESKGFCKRLAVRDLASGELIEISQDLGSGSTACNLDPGGLANACQSVERAISEGGDVVVLSKFGKLEAARGGLCDAFRAAIMADLPIITAVSSIFSEYWLHFAGSLSNDVAPAMDALDAWWSASENISMWSSSRRFNSSAVKRDHEGRDVA